MSTATYTPRVPTAAQEPARAAARVGPTSRPQQLRTTRGQHLESLAIFLIFGIVYAVLGYIVVTKQHVVVFEALDRLSRAYLVWHDAPPKLAVVGFDLPPVPTLLLLPAALIKPFATSLVALPVTSAIFAAGILTLVNRLLTRCEMPALMRYPVLLLFGANPLFVFYATNGMPDMMYLFLLTATLYSLLSWLLAGSTRFLILAGLALAFCVLARYEFIVWALPLTLMVGATLTWRRASRAEIEGTSIVFAAPFCYALALWSLFNALIVGAPFHWLTNSGSSLAVNSDQIASHGGASFDMVLSRLTEIVTGTAPLAFAVLPLLLLIFFTRRDEASLWLAGLIALAVAVVGASALIEDDIGLVVLHNGLTIAVTALIGAAWVYRSANGARLPVWLVMLALLGATLPLAWHRMETYPYQNQEQAFARALETGKDQEGTTSIGGYHVGIAPELRMASFINKGISEEHAILTDNSQTYAVILLSGRPQLFFDRVQQGDSVWKSVAQHPFGRVSYMLIANETPNDQLRQRYPNAAAGTDPTFPVVFKTSRYSLVRVPARPPTLSAGNGLLLPQASGSPPPASSTSEPSSATNQTPGTSSAQPPAATAETAPATEPSAESAATTAPGY
jgi:hypothetical protein